MMEAPNGIRPLREPMGVRALKCPLIPLAMSALSLWSRGVGVSSDHPGNAEADADDQAESVVTDADDSFSHRRSARTATAPGSRWFMLDNREHFPTPDRLPAGERVDTPPTD